MMTEAICFLLVLLASRLIVFDPLCAQATFKQNPTLVFVGLVLWAVIMAAYVFWRIRQNKQ